MLTEQITLNHIQHYYCQIEAIDRILEQYDFTWHDLWAVLENAKPFFNHGGHLLNIYNNKELNQNE